MEDHRGWTAGDLLCEGVYIVSNKYLIPDEALGRIRLRDKLCVYCQKEMIFPYDPKRATDSATIEHLSPEPPFYCPDMKIDNIVICCGACNSSRGTKQLRDWFRTNYCLEKGICEDKVAQPVKEYLLNLS